jgi:hypothetical protein
MKRLILILFSSVFSIVSYAQSEDFNKVYEACKLAQTSMSFVVGSQNEIEEAASLLTTLRWAPLILQEVDIKQEASMKNHMVFSPEYLSDVAKNGKVRKLAKKYAEEQVASQRGGDVKLCTKCIKGEGEVVYAMRHRGGSFNVAAVAEVNGLINLSVMVKDEKGNESKPYKINSEEFKGASCRKLENIQIPKGNSKVYITIENKSKEDKSIAIIVE